MIKDTRKNRIALARDIKAIRCRCLLTQVEFAKKLGVSLGTVRSWDQGLRMPSADSLRKISELNNRTENLLEKVINRQFTSIYDMNSNKIYTGDKVKLFNQVGTVCFECGAYGIAFDHNIDWDYIENQILPFTGCDNSLRACMNDNFISFWEIMNNFDYCEDNMICRQVGLVKERR